MNRVRKNSNGRKDCYRRPGPELDADRTTSLGGGVGARAGTGRDGRLVGSLGGEERGEGATLLRRAHAQKAGTQLHMRESSTMAQELRLSIQPYRSISS